MPSQGINQSSFVNVYKNVLALPGRKHFNKDGHIEICGVFVSLDTGLPISEAFLAYNESYEATLVGGRITDSELAHALDNAVKISHPAFFAGYFFKHYGHFLIESLSRIMPILLERDSPSAQGEYQELYYFSQWGTFDFSNPSLYFCQIFQGLGIDRESLYEIKFPMLFSELRIPIQTGGMGFAYEVHSRKLSVDTLALHRQLYKSFSSARFPEFKRQECHENIYVSRSELPVRHGKFLLEKLLEDIFEQCGWHIYYPEQHSLVHQIALYQSAKRVVFAEGSSLYSLLFISLEQAEMPPELYVILRRSAGAGLLKDIQLINPDLPLIVPIDAIVLEELFGSKDWNTYSILDFGTVLERLHMSSSGFELSPKAIDSERKSLASIITGLESDIVCRAILSISRYSAEDFFVVFKGLARSSSAPELLPDMIESVEESVASLVSSNYLEATCSALLFMARSISLPSPSSSRSPKSPMSSSGGNHGRLSDCGPQSMRKTARREAEWQAVIDAHPLESHDPAEWLRFGVALTQLIEPSAQERHQQQQAGLAFAHAEVLGAAMEAVALSQRQATLLSLAQALELADSGPAAAVLDRLAGLQLS